MFRKLLKIVGVVFLIIFIVGTLAFTSYESNEVVCHGIEIEFDNDDIIKINKDELIRLIKATDKDILNKDLDQINSETIEEAIEKHQSVYNAEVYKIMALDSGSYEGILAVKVNHRDPIVRIMSENGSYYLDEYGGKIPVSTNYTANVLVATGYMKEDFAKKDLLPFVIYVENDEFWQAQIEQIHVNKNGEVILIPLVGDHVIEFGHLEDYQKKLQRMRAFYEQVLANDNWNKYKTVSLKYNNQVVAKRR